MFYSKQLWTVVLTVLSASFFCGFAHAGANDPLPYCYASNPKTPPPSVKVPFFIARSMAGNYLMQWCNEYNLQKNRPWATDKKEVKLNKKTPYTVVKFLASSYKDAQQKVILKLTDFFRCKVKVNSPTSWQISTCTPITDVQGTAYVKRFEPKISSQLYY